MRLGAPSVPSETSEQPHGVAPVLTTRVRKPAALDEAVSTNVAGRPSHSKPNSHSPKTIEAHVRFARLTRRMSSGRVSVLMLSVFILQVQRLRMTVSSEIDRIDRRAAGFHIQDAIGRHR